MIHASGATPLKPFPLLRPAADSGDMRAVLASLVEIVDRAGSAGIRAELRSLLVLTDGLIGAAATGEARRARTDDPAREERMVGGDARIDDYDVLTIAAVTGCVRSGRADLLRALHELNMARQTLLDAGDSIIGHQRTKPFLIHFGNEVRNALKVSAGNPANTRMGAERGLLLLPDLEALHLFEPGPTARLIRSWREGPSASAHRSRRRR